MSYLVIRHKVADFKRWKPVYDEHLRARDKAHLKELHLLRGRDDPEELIILFETDDPKRAREFIESKDLKETMKKAGVIDEPTFYILEEAA